MGGTASKPKQGAFVAAARRASDGVSDNGVGQKLSDPSVDGKENNTTVTNLYRDDDENDDAEDACCLPLPVGVGGGAAASSSRSGSASLPPSSSTSTRKGKEKQPEHSRRSTLPKPKKLLWGCTNAEEHYQYIIDACDRVQNLRGAKGLKELGLEYRMVHDPFNCRCEGIDLEDMADIGPGGSANNSATFDELDPRLWEEEKVDAKNDDNNNHDEEYTEPLLLDEEEEYMVPIGTPLADVSAETATSKTSETLMLDEEDAQDNNSTATLTKSRLEGLNEEEDNTATTLTTSPSNVSLFSLATHHTWTSGEDREDAMELEHGCALRLIHVPPPGMGTFRPPTLIEADNYEIFIANGRMYDEVARLCMEYAQDLMIDEGDLEWFRVDEERSISALVTRTGFDGQERKRPILLIITGKGKVRAGIFSRRHIITTGIEMSTALPMIREARKRNMACFIVDPNARGDVNGMDTLDATLTRLFGVANDNSDEQGGGVFIIAHSMGGAQIQRYLHGDKQVGAATNSNDDGGEERLALFRQIKAVVFTDSNHNINWTKKTNPELTAMLEGPSCLYIKSHKLHQEEPKELGAMHHECSFWTHRFGLIRTIFAGTSQHALTNFTARNYMWDHFDNFLEESIQEQDGVEEVVDGEKAPSF
mmetsp:Transcript_3626/g.10309  ORF Transcript_3626/g.10309 Transcript_3626/m.10309 type:complete len:649 (-) Transcript_3626:1397-3343(-)